jgi:hypothetical protein
MRRHGLESVPNTPEEIAEAVQYKFDVMDGVIRPPYDEVEPMLSYRAAMAHNPMMFGAARPVLPFLKRHPEVLQGTVPAIVPQRRSGTVEDGLARVDR